MFIHHLNNDICKCTVHPRHTWTEDDYDYRDRIWVVGGTIFTQFFHFFTRFEKGNQIRG
jgi:hypothetical protein